MGKQLLHVKAETLKEVEEGTIQGVVGSTEVLDRMGESISQEGWELTNYKKNPVVLWGHNVREERPPIGKATKLWLDGVRKKKLMFDIKFDMADQFAAEIYRKVKEGFINTVSVGFLPIESEPIDKKDSGIFGPQKYIKQELLELSYVPVPANPEALSALKSMNLHGQTPIKTLESVYRKPEYDLAPKTESWDGPGEVAKAGDKDIFAVDKLLPHHNASDGRVVYRGIKQSMALLLGAKEGVPEEKREEAYEHIARHYQEFEEEAPEFKYVEDQVLKSLDEEIHSLVLEREDKHQTRLIKKVINLNKNKPKSPTEGDIIAALKTLDKALELAKGGEK